MFGSIHLSGATLERTVENATTCDDCEVGGVDLTHGSGERFDLCRRHYWELVVESRGAVEGETDDAETGDRRDDDSRTHLSSVDRTALESFGIDVDPGATSVTRAELADLDVAEVAAGVPEDPDAVRVLGLLAAVDPDPVAERTAAVEACLPIAESWDDGAAGASRVLGSVASVDPGVARTLLSAAATGDVPHHVARAIHRAVQRDLAAMRSLRTDDGESVLVETIAEAGRSGAKSSPLFATALLVAREDPGAFVDHVPAFLAPLEGEFHHQEAAGTAFDAAATLGRVATVDPEAVDGLRGKLRALGERAHPHPETGAILRAAGAVAFAHSPTLAGRASVDRAWLRDRLTTVLDFVDVPAPTREEAAMALGRFADEDDREYLSWVAQGSETEVQGAARRAAAGDFLVEWPDGVLDPDTTDGRTTATPPLSDALPDDPPWDVSEEYAVGFAVFDALGATPEGTYRPAADQWAADWTAPLARLTATHRLAVLELDSTVDLNALALSLGLDDVTYHPDHLPFLRYDPGPGRPPAFASSVGVVVCPRVTDRSAAEESLVALSEAAAEIRDDAVETSGIRFTSVGDLLE